MGGAKRLARVAVLVALALALGYVERLLPLPAPAPGIKLGLGNLVVVVALYLFGFRDALSVSALRVVLGGALFGTGFSAAYALCGALCSFFAMAGLSRAGLHVVTVSAVGGLAHNLAQLALAAAVVGTPGLLGYLPALAVSGLGTGVAIGAAASVLIGRLKQVAR